MLIVDDDDDNDRENDDDGTWWWWWWWEKSKGIYFLQSLLLAKGRWIDHLLQIEIIVAPALSTCKRDEDLGNLNCFGGFVLRWKKYLKKLETKKYLEPKWPQFEFSFDETLLVLAKKPLIFMGRQIRMQKKLIWVVWFLLKVARPSNLANLPSLSKWFLILASCSFSQQFIYIWVETVACWGDSIWPKKRGVEFAGFKFVWNTKRS